MENSQVTFVISAPISTRPVGDPILVASIASAGDERRLIILENPAGQFVERIVMPWRGGYLKPAQADIMGIELGDALYGILCRREGLVSDLGLLRE